MSVSSNPIATGWLNENSLREYPFHEGCGLRPYDSAGALVDGGWTLPNCLIVDMSMSVLSDGYDPYLYLGEMSVVGRAVTLVFFDRDGNRAAYLRVDGDEHVEYDSYQIAGMGSWSGARGVVCVGSMDRFLDMTPEGIYRFAPEETRIEPTCIRPSVSGVRSLRATDDSGYMSIRMSGDVELIAGENIRFDYDPASNALVVSAVQNAGYSEDCDCSASGGAISIRSINGIQVDHLNIVGDDCIKISGDGGVITMSDDCSKPCCGCAETAFINQTINDLQTTVNTLSVNVASLGDRLTEFMTSYVLSRKTTA